MMKSFKIFLFLFAILNISEAKELKKNVFGENLETCSESPLTGFTRTGIKLKQKRKTIV